MEIQEHPAAESGAACADGGEYQAEAEGVSPPPGAASGGGDSVFSAEDDGDDADIVKGPWTPEVRAPSPLVCSAAQWTVAPLRASRPGFAASRSHVGASPLGRR